MPHLHSHDHSDHHSCQPPPYCDPPADGDKKPDMLEDQKLFKRTLTAFRSYEMHARSTLAMRARNLRALSPQHQQLLLAAGVHVDAFFEQYHAGITANQEFLGNICDAADDLFESYWPDVNPDAVPEEQPSSMDYDKVFSTLKQFVRDWSEEGRIEREQVYQPMLAALEGHFPDRNRRSQCRVLVPGAGLCRLSVEVALRGFSCQANEFSYHMLIAGHYAQNHLQCARQHTIHPFVDTTCNLVNRGDQFLPVAIPDLCTMDAVMELEAQKLSFGELSMVAGDFTEVYAKPSQRGQWEAVLTCFFIDTAHNVIEYMEILWQLLAPGGLWVNCGPLLYHFAEDVLTTPPVGGEVVSVELSLGEVVQAAQAIGFVLLAPCTFVDTTYTNNFRSMKQLVYRTALFSMRKPF